MKALLRVGVFVQVRAVEIAEAVFVAGEVRGDPVEDDADTVLMQVVDHVHQVLRGAITARRGEVAGRLIAPGAVERMLGQRHELDVGEAEVFHMGRPAWRQLRGSAANGRRLRGRASTSQDGLRRWTAGADSALRWRRLAIQS